MRVRVALHRTAPRLVRRVAAALRGIALVLASLAAAPALPAAAAPVSPLDPARFAFPGSRAAPASAASAGLALADQWLAAEPFANPAAPSQFQLVASPALFRVSRQDLRSANRNFDETAAFLDGAGGVLGLPSWGRLSVSFYGFQPVLRKEDHAYLRGLASSAQEAMPAILEGHASAREFRAGMAVAGRLGPGAIGVGVEWSRREDSYEALEASANPATAGRDSVGFSGDAIGVQLGARWAHGDTTAGAFQVGLGARYLPRLAVDGAHTVVRGSGTTREPVHAERTSAWESGVSVRYFVSTDFRALAAAGVRGEQSWEGLGVVAGRAWEWKLGGEYHAQRDAWTVRFGLGQEFQSDAPEPRANLLGLGVGWQWSSMGVDLGLVRRSISRGALPHWFDDRVVMSVRVPL